MDAIEKCEYWDNGKLKSKCTYVDGKRHGLYEAWYKNGKLSAKRNYIHGKLDGECEWWDSRGNLICSSDCTLEKWKQLKEFNDPFDVTIILADMLEVIETV